MLSPRSQYLETLLLSFTLSTPLSTVSRTTLTFAFFVNLPLNFLLVARLDFFFFFSELIAEELLVKLQLLKKNCQLSDDPNIIQTLATDIRPGNLVIIISLNGETPELVEAARRISQNRAPILLITTNGTSSIGKYASLILCGFKSETTYFPAYEVHSRLPLQVITRVLLDSYVIRTKK